MAGRIILLGLVSLGALSAAMLACGGAGERKTAATKRPIGVGDATLANTKLADAVRAKLNTNPQLEAAQLAVSADVTQNQVTLSGTVGSEALRDEAVELAKSAQVGVLVSDRLTVKPAAANPGHS